MDKPEKERPRARLRIPMTGGERGNRRGCQKKSHAIFPCVGMTMMRFRKGQWHLSVGEVFSGSVSPPPLLLKCHPVSLSSPQPDDEGAGGPKVLTPSSGLGHLTPPCNSCLMPLVRTKPASVPHSDPTWPPQPNTMQLSVSLYQAHSVPSLPTCNAGLYKLISSC